MTTLSYASNIITESNSRNVSNGSLIFGIDGNSQKPITSNDTRLTIAIADIIISEVLSFNLSQIQYSRRYWIWQGMFQRLIFLIIESSYPKNYLMILMNKT